MPTVFTRERISILYTVSSQLILRTRTAVLLYCYDKDYCGKFDSTHKLLITYFHHASIYSDLSPARALDQATAVPAREASTSDHLYAKFPISTSSNLNSGKLIVLGSTNKIVKKQRKLLATSNQSTKSHVPCLLYTSPSPRDGLLSRMPSSA